MEIFKFFRFFCPFWCIKFGLFRNIWEVLEACRLAGEFLLRNFTNLSTPSPRGEHLSSTNIFQTLLSPSHYISFGLIKSKPLYWSLGIWLNSHILVMISGQKESSDGWSANRCMHWSNCDQFRPRTSTDGKCFPQTSRLTPRNSQRVKVSYNKTLKVFMCITFT